LVGSGAGAGAGSPAVSVGFAGFGCAGAGAAGLASLVFGAGDCFAGLPFDGEEVVRAGLAWFDDEGDAALPEPHEREDE